MRGERAEGRRRAARDPQRTLASDRALPQRGAEVPCWSRKRSRAITGNLIGWWLGCHAHRVWPHQVLLRAIFEGEWRERGLRRAAPTRSVHSSRSARKMPRRLPSLTLFWICGRRRRRPSVSSINWDVLVRANAGQGWRMDSSGHVSRLLNGSTCEREGAGGARPRGAVGRRERAHRTAGVVRAGRVP